MAEGTRGRVGSDDVTGLEVMGANGDEVATGAKVIGAEVRTGDTVCDGAALTVCGVTVIAGFDLATGGNVTGANGLPVAIAAGAKVIGVDVVTG